MVQISEGTVTWLKVGLYSGLLFFSFFMIIAVPVTTNNIGGCILYANKLFFGSASNCNYVIAIAVIFQLFYAPFRLVSLVLRMLNKLPAEFVLFGDVVQLIYAVMDFVSFFLTFISACILSAGINSACHSAGTSCSLVLWVNYDTSAISRMQTAEAGAWISFILWLALVLVGVFWLYRQGKIPFLSPPAPTGEAGSSNVPPSGGQPNLELPVVYSKY